MINKSFLFNKNTDNNSDSLDINTFKKSQKSQKSQNYQNYQNSHYSQKSQILIFDFATLQTQKGSNTITLHILGFSILGSGIFTTQFF